MEKENIVKLDGHSLTIEDVYKVAYDGLHQTKVTLCPDALEKMKASREYVYKIVEAGKPVYGINTGFGALSNKHIEKKDLNKLQVNLIRSHCTGVGEAFKRETTRAIMVLRANCLASGFSGLNPELVQLLIDFLNLDVTPIVPKKGSVGASGDLAPLSHIAITLMGEGEVLYKGEIIPAADAIKKIGKKPVELGPKDGLALINGTAVMAALGAMACFEAENLVKLADVCASMTLEGVRGTSQAYFEGISRLKPHEGQLQSSENLNLLLKDSEILTSHPDCGKVQDPYSLRCVPQVHGACRQTLRHATEVVSTELNSVTDNPLIFIEEDKVVSGGNFHGEALALVMDYLAMGLAELCNICERRIEKMMNPVFSDLPAFLTKESGLNSGLMIAHVTAAALASENKFLCHPASIDSIPTSTDKEDHVSMGVTAGRKLHEVLGNLKHCLAIELLCNTQALDLLKPLKSSPPITAIHELIRKHVPEITEDRYFKKDIDTIRTLIDENRLMEAIVAVSGGLK